MSYRNWVTDCNTLKDVLDGMIISITEGEITDGKCDIVLISKTHICIITVPAMEVIPSPLGSSHNEEEKEK
jgi:hypothetical protein